VFRPSRWPRLPFPRPDRRPGSPGLGSRPPSALWARQGRLVRWLAAGLFAAWVIGAAPFLLLTPAGGSLVALFAGWGVAPPSQPLSGPGALTATVESEPAAAPLEVAAVEPAATATPSLGPAPGRTLGVEAASVVDPSATEVALPDDRPDGERFAFLLMGYGGGRHEGGFLTDSMMVVIVDPVRRTLALLSIPRDAWIPMSFDGKTTFYNKANTAYAFGRDESLYPNRLARYAGERGAGLFAADTMARLLGVPIRYYLVLDFAGFRQMIDAVGGVDFEVPRGFAARYPANDDPTIDPTWTVVRFRAGEQRMNGERAIQYARAREALDDSGEGSDFARSRRQRLIMEAFKTRLLQPSGLLALPKLLAIASSHVDTNYDLPGAAQIGDLMLDWKSVRLHQTALTLANYLDEATGPDGAYVLVPSISDHSWTQVRSFARRLWDDPEAGVAAAQTPVTVVNASGSTGLAGRIGGALVRLGYMVRAPTSAPTRRETRLLDGTGGKADALARRLAKELGAELAPSPGAETEGLVLELGSVDAELAAPPTPSEAAPYSIAGITKFGLWLPAPEPEPEAARPLAPATASVVGTPGLGSAATATPAAASGTPLVPGRAGAGPVVTVTPAAAAAIGTPARPGGPARPPRPSFGAPGPAARPTAAANVRDAPATATPAPRANRRGRH
jgi:LCP family protein required for cell wall assembly